MERSDASGASSSSGATPLRLVLSAIPAPLTEPVLQGEATPRGVELSTQRAGSVDGNSRQMLTLAFDVAEMSFATFLRAREDGVPLVGLPIFTGRRFLQPGITVRADAAVRTPADLAGKRVGLPQFWMTSSVWHRGVLHSEYGVAQPQVIWYTSREERMDSLVMPDDVEVRATPEGTAPEALLAAGELDGLMMPRPGKTGGEGPSRIVQPFDDLGQTQRDYYRRTGVFPIMHFVVMKETLDREHPGLAASLCEAFAEAKDKAVTSGADLAPVEGDSPEQTRALFGEDPWAYGLARNRPALETFLGYAREQGLVQRDVSVEELFAPSTRHLFE